MFWKFVNRWFFEIQLRRKSPFLRSWYDCLHIHARVDGGDPAGYADSDPSFVAFDYALKTRRAWTTFSSWRNKGKPIWKHCQQTLWKLMFQEGARPSLGNSIGRESEAWEGRGHKPAGAIWAQLHFQCWPFECEICSTWDSQGKPTSNSRQLIETQIHAINNKLLCILIW